RIDFGSIDISRPSHSEKAASHSGWLSPRLAALGTMSCTSKLNVVNGSSATAIGSDLRGEQLPLAGARQLDGEELHRLRGRDANLGHEPPPVDPLRRVDARAGRHPVGLLR